MFMPRLCAMAELDECIEYELSTCLAPQSDDLFGFGSFGSLGTSLQLDHWGPFHCTMLHSCCTAILSTYRLSTFSISAVDSGVLSQVARSKPKTLFRVGMRPFLRSAAFASSDLVRFLSDFYGFLGGPVAWSELDAQRRLSGAEDSFVLFVDIE